MGPCGTRAGSFFNLNAGVLVWFQCALDVSKDKQSLKLETVCRLFVPLCQETLAAKLQTSQLRLARATLSSRFKVKIISLAPSETPWRRIAVKMPVALLPARRHCLARVECHTFLPWNILCAFLHSRLTCPSCSLQFHWMLFWTWPSPTTKVWWRSQDASSFSRQQFLSRNLWMALSWYLAAGKPSYRATVSEVYEAIYGRKLRYVRPVYLHIFLT